MEKEMVEKITGEVLRSLPTEDVIDRTYTMKKMCHEFGMAFLGR